MKHIKGHRRLGTGYGLCADKISVQKGPNCETCAGLKLDEDFRARETDLIRKNYEAIRSAKITAEEALLESKHRILSLEKQMEELRSAYNRNADYHLKKEKEFNEFVLANTRPIRAMICKWLKQCLTSLTPTT
ncbi:MAG: hypothetical protein AAB875_01985 [Patescibacteria group bacterium]